MNRSWLGFPFFKLVSFVYGVSLVNVVGPGGAAGRKNVPFADIARRPLILPSRSHGLRILIDTIAARENLELQIDFELDSLAAIKELVEDGTGWSILSFASVYREVEAGRLTARRIVKPNVSRSLVLATSTQRPLSQAARVVVDQIKSEVDDLVATGKWLGTQRRAGS